MLQADMGVFVSLSDSQSRIVDSNLQTVRELPHIPAGIWSSCAASDLGLFSCYNSESPECIRRYELEDFTVVAEHLNAGRRLRRI